MKKKDEIAINSCFAIIFFWDIIDYFIPYAPFLLLIIVLVFGYLTQKKQVIEKNMLIALGVVVAHAFINIIIGNDSLNLFIKQIVSIICSYLVFANILHKNSVLDIFKRYLKWVYFVSLICVLQELIAIFQINILTRIPFLFLFVKYDYRILGFIRVSAFCAESSFLVYLLAPAMFLVLCDLFGSEFLETQIHLTTLKKTIISIAYVCTFSAIAYLGILLMFVMIWYKKGISVKKVLIPFLAIIFIAVMYIYIPDIRMRVDDTLFLLNNRTSDTILNLSSYALISNMQVAVSCFKHSLGLGSGLGSYPLMYDKYATMRWGGDVIGLNREDANSFVLRVLSEFGIWGIVIVAIFIIKYIPKNKKYVGYSFAILSMLLLLGLRQGNYTHAGSVFFVLLYRKIYMESKIYIKK